MLNSQCEGEWRAACRNVNHQLDGKYCALTDRYYPDTFTTTNFAHNGLPQGNQRAVALR